MADREHLERLTRTLTDQGKLIEAGWVSLRLAAVPLDAPATQLDEMRNAFFAGAQHLFSSIMTMMEDGADATDGDMSRLGLIQTELDGFIESYRLRHVPSEGQA